LPFQNQSLREKSAPKEVVQKPSVGKLFTILQPEAPKTVSQPVGSLKTNNISIKEALKPPVAEGLEESNREFTTSESKPLDLESLLMHWKKYAHVLLSQDKTNLFSMMTKRNPRIINDNTFTFELDNDIVKGMFGTELNDLMGYLRQSFKNGSLQLNLTLSAEEISANNPYSPAEKFKVLAEKNPNISTLQSTFNLDLDY